MAALWFRKPHPRGESQVLLVKRSEVLHAFTSWKLKTFVCLVLAVSLPLFPTRRLNLSRSPCVNNQPVWRLFFSICSVFVPPQSISHPHPYFQVPGLNPLSGLSAWVLQSCRHAVIGLRVILNCRPPCGFGCPALRQHDDGFRVNRQDERQLISYLFVTHKICVDTFIDSLRGRVDKPISANLWETLCSRPADVSAGI